MEQRLPGLFPDLLGSTQGGATHAGGRKICHGKSVPHDITVPIYPFQIRTKPNTQAGSSTTVAAHNSIVVVEVCGKIGEKSFSGMVPEQFEFGRIFVVCFSTDCCPRTTALQTHPFCNARMTSSAHQSAEAMTLGYRVGPRKVRRALSLDAARWAGCRYGLVQKYKILQVLPGTRSNRTRRSTFRRTPEINKVCYLGGSTFAVSWIFASYF